ncbi:Hypothetical predicted protein [Cloeon dipterum]|uniref:Uncharacterized protein n=1 Tax=Cloeon dipterum TaxID=197152 RepID=A0A8S1BVN3_9INSE|nr:Hypothetical predicted protein [Cloeon dipterum]
MSFTLSRARGHRLTPLLDVVIAPHGPYTLANGNRSRIRIGSELDLSNGSTSCNFESQESSTVRDGSIEHADIMPTWLHYHTEYLPTGRNDVVFCGVTKTNGAIFVAKVIMSQDTLSMASDTSSPRSCSSSRP